MLGRGKIIGPVLILIGAGICLLVSIFVGVGAFQGNVTLAGAVLGVAAFGVLPLLFFGGAGAYLFISGQKEEAELESIRKKERIIGLIQTQGQASVSTVMLELKMDRQQVTEAMYELTAQGLFSGYIDWDAMTFYSKEASKVGSNQCPNCGGTREFVGQGVIKCPYCGVSLFIPPDAPQTRAEPKPPEEKPA